MTSSRMSKVFRKMKGLMLRYLPGMITCAEFDAFIVSYLDGGLPETQRRLFERHIRFCRECRDYLKAYRHTIALGKSAFPDPEGSPPDNVPDDLV
ncbi:MAG: anti-sigma factor family protein, partial [Hyphomicrobiaceae bacterium]